MTDRPEPSASRAALSASGPLPPGDPRPLVGLAHGSRHPQARQSLDRLLAAVRDCAGARGLELDTRAAFLDILSPDLARTAAQLAADGHRTAVVVPLLFTSAFHATVDVPDTVREAVASVGVELSVAPILGTGEDVADVLAATVVDAGLAATSDLLLYAVGSSDESANEAVRDLAGRLGRRRGSRVRACFGTRPPRGPELLDALVDSGAEAAVVPLFAAPGLLLDPMAAAARRHGVPITAPLEDRLAPLVLARYLSQPAR